MIGISPAEYALRKMREQPKPSKKECAKCRLTTNEFPLTGRVCVECKSEYSRRLRNKQRGKVTMIG